MNLLTGLAIDVHGSTSFLLILLDVIAELRIHERLIAVGTAALHVFSPQELFTDSVAEQFFVDVVVVWHTLLRAVALFWIKT